MFIRSSKLGSLNQKKEESPFDSCKLQFYIYHLNLTAFNRNTLNLTWNLTIVGQYIGLKLLFRMTGAVLAQNCPELS